jgi:hypothetical protein
MASPQEKLAEALEVLRKLQDRRVVAIRPGDLKRGHRERLLKSGFLQEVMKGWYIAVRPDDAAGESAVWYASFWAFCAAYLRERFGSDWCLSPEHSLSLHAGNTAVPIQLVIRSPKAGNKATALPYETSLFDVRAAVPEEKNIETRNGLRLFSLPAALIAISPGFFENNSTDARSALAAIRNASEVLDRLLEGGHSTVAGRRAGAFRNLGRDRIADDIVNTMRAAGYTVREQDPFASRIELVLPRREASPYAGRIRVMWQQIRGAVIERFPASPGRPKNINAYLKHVEDVYVTDAYHSLSIEGYRVDPGLIERVRKGAWNPDANEQDREQRNALAARGYWLAFQSVQKSLRRVLRGENPGAVADENHGAWYRELLGPSVTAGLLRPADLAGYRNGPVYIRRSTHVPPNPDAVRDAMPVFFEMLTEESEPSVRIVLGLFIFVYIHPYMDGNGRIGRFLMNVMLAASGYPWTVVPLHRRDAYLAALEDASVRQNIAPFADFVAQLVDEGLRGKPVAKIPAD